jgi:hypothetical protein
MPHLFKTSSNQIELLLDQRSTMVALSKPLAYSHSNLPDVHAGTPRELKFRLQHLLTMFDQCLTNV